MLLVNIFDVQFQKQINIACIRIRPGRTMSSLRNASQISFNQHIKQLIKSSLKLYQALKGVCSHLI